MRIWRSHGGRIHWTLKIAFALGCFSIPMLVNSQGTYELLYVSRMYDSILTISNSLDNATDYYWNAIAKRQSGNLAGSVKVLEQGVLEYPDDEIIKELLGELYFTAGHYSDARPILNASREQRDYFLMLIRILEFESDHTGAISLLSDRIKSDSSDAELMGRLAENYIKADSVSRARDILETLVARDSADQRSLVRLANVYLQLREYSEAIMTCNRALEIDSTHLTLHRIKGFATFRSGNFKEATESFRYLLQRGDSGKVVLKHLGISEIKEYEFDRARKHLLKLHSLDSTDQEVCFFLGRAFLNSDKPQDGLHYLELADSLAQPDPKILAAICLEKIEIYTSLKMHREAIESYEEAYRYIQNPEYLFFMASSYQFNLEDKSMALRMYERFVESLPATEKPEERDDDAERVVSMKEVAIRNIEKLREELFFEGELKE